MGASKWLFGYLIQIQTIPPQTVPILPTPLAREEAVAFLKDSVWATSLTHVGYALTIFRQQYIWLTGSSTKWQKHMFITIFHHMWMNRSISYNKVPFWNEKLQSPYQLWISQFIINSWSVAYITDLKIQMKSWGAFSAYWLVLMPICWISIKPSLAEHFSNDQLENSICMKIFIFQKLSPDWNLDALLDCNSMGLN